MSGVLYCNINQRYKATKTKNDDSRKRLKCKSIEINFKCNFLKGNKSEKLRQLKDTTLVNDKFWKKMQNDSSKKSR